MDGDIIEISERNRANSVMEQYMKIEEIPGIVITNVKTTNVLLVNTSMECVQFNFDCNFQLDFKVHIKIIYPKKVPNNLNIDPIKLRIDVEDDNVRKEIIICTNYLQRKRDIDLALSVLKQCSVFVSERKLIYNMILLHFDGFVNSSFHEDGGIMIECEDNKTGFKFFHTLWKIHFNCEERYLLDLIDFNITKQDRKFYRTAKPVMLKLISPNVSYANKVELWSVIVQAANLSIRENAVLRQWRDEGVLIEEINSTQITHYDLSDSDSDDDSCVVIEDD